MGTAVSPEVLELSRGAGREHLGNGRKAKFAAKKIGDLLYRQISLLVGNRNLMKFGMNKVQRVLLLGIFFLRTIFPKKVLIK